MTFRIKRKKIQPNLFLYFYIYVIISWEFLVCATFLCFWHRQEGGENVTVVNANLNDWGGQHFSFYEKPREEEVRGENENADGLVLWRLLLSFCYS